MKQRGAWLVTISIAIGCGSRSELLLGDVPGSDAAPGAEDSDGRDARPAPDAARDLGVDVPASLCPLDPPRTSDACPVRGAVCTYRRGKVGPCSDATASDQQVFRCEADGWLEVARCIDPTDCPATPPPDGTTCRQHGLDCFYSSPTCATGSIAQCESDVWTSVNDCGARARTGPPCVLTPTLVDAQRIVLEGAGTIADRATVATAGTQLLAAWVITPKLGGAESIEWSVLQSAVPAMAAPLPFVFFGRSPGDTAPAADFAGDRFAVVWGSREPASLGVWGAAPPLDGASGSLRLDGRPADRVDVATSLHDGAVVGWMVERYRAGDFKSGTETAALPIADASHARGPAQVLGDDRDHGPGVGKLNHVWAAIARWKSGFVLVSSVGPAGDLWDDTGVAVWFVSDPAATKLPPPVRFAIGQTLDGDVVSLTDGSVVLATMKEGAPPREPYVLLAVRPDGSSTTLPPPDLGVAISPRRPRLAAFEDGFVVAFAAEAAVASDDVAGLLTLSLRSASGAMIVDPIVERAPNLTGQEPMAIAVSAVDRALDVTWTQGPSTGPGGLARVMRQRFVCRGSPPVD